MCHNVNLCCIILTEYGYGGSYVGGTGAGQVPPRLPLVSGLPGPNPPIAAPNVSLNKNIMIISSFCIFMKFVLVL